MPSRQVVIASRRPPRIGGPLRALLEERFLTQAELAHAIGVHERNINRWVRNETGPTKRRIRAIAEYFDVPPASLIDHSGDGPLAA